MPQLLRLPVDDRIYEQYLRDFLPSRLIDTHTHIWLKKFETSVDTAFRGAAWANKVAPQNSLENLLQEYQLMLPGKDVTPVVFGWPSRNVDLEMNNQWVSEQARRRGLPTLVVCRPEIQPLDLQRMVIEGGFAGLKPYLDFAPAELAPDEISIYDFLPPAQLEVANANGWVVLLHIPRSGRLKDPLNLIQMVEIERKYPRVKLIIAHLGRAYCPGDIGDAVEVLKRTERMAFDFSAHTCTEVMVDLLRVVGSRRIIFGSDMPITHMRMRRICAGNSYINLVPPGLYGDLSGDPHIQEEAEHPEELTYFLYEELLAMRRAAEVLNLTSADVSDVFYHNAAALFNLDQAG